MNFYTIKVTTEEEATRICQELTERGFSEKTDVVWFKTFVNTTCDDVWFKTFENTTGDVRVSVIFMWRIRP